MMPSSSTDPLEILTGALRDKQPLVLLAGQSLDAAHHAILDALLSRFGCADRSLGWRAAIEHGISAADMTWLSERFERSVPADAAGPIFEVVWSAVFTSSIDPRFARRFETRGRQPESLLYRGTYAKVPRSRSRPPIHYLLGKSDETNEDARAPRNQNDLTRRLSLHATELLNRVAETATVRGLVVMAGYDASKDWMPVDWLLAPLSRQTGPKVLWFGYPGKPGSPLADEMIEQGTLVAVPTTLASAINQLELRGVLDVAGSAAPDDPGLVSITGDMVLNITPALRLRVEASAAIVDDGWTEDPEPLGESEADDAFRRFHGTLGNFRLLVEGVSRGFAIEREFEQTLWKTVKSKVERLGQADSDDVVVLHGQSGTGKSIALARLTQRIRRELRLPVVVATNRIPNHTDIQAFCLESERLGAAATVLICDSSQAPQRYDDLTAALRSLGRRLLIVGTCYRMETHIGGGLNRLVEALSDVSKSELSAFENLLNKFGHNFLPRDRAPTTDSIFAMLYRRLPVSRGRLAAGVSSEARVTESMMRERARHVPQPATGFSEITKQLIELGIVASPDSQVFGEDEKLAALGLDAAGRLVDYVMAAGRLNCAVPVNLIFRALDQTDGLYQEQVIYLLDDLDLFRWRENEEGSDFLISPRIQLEAELICRRRLTSDQEIERLLDLICGVKLGMDQSAERSFLLGLLFMIDRNGPRQEAYRPGYLRFADALKQLREHSQIFDPDLVLRECVFRRRTVFRLQGGEENRTDGERFAILDEARETIEKTLRQIDDKNIPVSKKTKQSLVAERSAIYGYLTVQRAQSDTGEDFWSDYLAARAASEKAIGLGRHSHPIDIALWTASDVLELKKGELSDERRAEVLADLYATIDVADDVFGVKEQRLVPSASYGDDDPDDLAADLDQKERYLARRSKVAHVMGDQELGDKTLAELESTAPAAAIFLIARRQAEPVYKIESPFDDKTRKIAAQAADYISDRADVGIALDDRCRRLLLRLRWAQATGEHLMFKQRGRTPVDADRIFDLRAVVNALNDQSGVDARNRERFLEAVLCWLLNDTNRASEIWRSLSYDTEYEDRSRVVRWLVTTDERGFPRQFRGRVEKQGENDWVRVEGIERPIRVLARDFPDDSLVHGRELRNFGIAFNYIGPIADPLHSRPVRRR